MNVIKDSCFTRSSQVVFIKMTFINMHSDNFKAHQSIVIILSNFFFPFVFTFKIDKTFLYHWRIYHIGFYRG